MSDYLPLSSAIITLFYPDGADAVVHDLQDSSTDVAPPLPPAIARLVDALRLARERSQDD